MNTDQVVALIAAPEAEHLECKAARTRFDFEDLAKYACAIANEGGGVILLGVSDRRPRNVVGTAAFQEPGRTSSGLFERLGARVIATEHLIGEKRVLAFEVPSRNPGYAVSCRGAYWMRAGESLVAMPDDRLRAIHAELEPDFTAGACEGLVVADLSADAIEQFRHRWIQRNGHARLATLDSTELLSAAELVVPDGGITYAALLLLGTSAALGRYLPSGEIVYEYRSGEAAGPAQHRQEFRQGFLLTADPLWEVINARNDRQSIQEGFFRREVPTFDEKVIREAILNAAAHRSYRDQRSVFVRQFARRMEVISPGGFPGSVTAENILGAQHPRNRRLAESFGRIGLVDRAGQGVNLMFERSVRQGKRVPDYAGTTSHEVRLTLDGVVSSPRLVTALERIGEEQLRTFATDDFLVLDRLQRGETVPDTLRPRLPILRERGLVESQGRGRSTRYFPSRRLSLAIGQAGAYTRRRGLDRSANKQLLLQHLKDAGSAGSSLQELEQVLPGLSRSQIQGLLQSLRDDGGARIAGSRRWAKWLYMEGLLKAETSRGEP